ncbi:MAG: D-alanyl-D-alanine carboxypeptidase [Peptoclostridium sp.]|uniref:D-alanyl-D-alanine carboxypeptidase family protein n=1 Tax=Peptoclostridium sp. TaxID=1904860 RepID=UPI00139E7973|nr:D-alanyl-D-alanine carboxypeptidase family protein [Peptoclostridium sp.]MZQ76001.1 D-alanyl-D-alanine carboxypeptidase [Peptoclostridium sp.]
MRRYLCIIISFIVFISTNITAFSQGEDELGLTGEAAVLINADGTEILYEKNAHQKMYPASTTKIMTALLTVENCNLDDVVTIDYDPGYIDGSSMYVKQGETFTVRQLLEFMLVRSANDAAVALANHISGSTDKFKDLMNKRAKELGCKDTHFNNPNGLPDVDHYTSAYDLALIAKEAMKHEDFRKTVKLEKVSLPPTELTPEWRVYRNTNKFLWSNSTIDYKGGSVKLKYDVINGIKTGYTNVARNCLVTSASKDGLNVISVVLKAEGRNVYIDSRTLIDYGLDNYHVENVIGEDEARGEKHIFLSNEGSLKYGPQSNFSIVLKNGETLDKSNVRTNTVLHDKLDFPVKKGTEIGYIEIYKDDSLLSKIKLVALNDVTLKFDYLMLKIVGLKAAKFISLLLASLFCLCLIIRFINLKKRRKKSRARRRASYDIDNI